MNVNKLILFSLLVASTTVVMAQDPWVYAKEATDVWPGADAKAALVLDDGILTVGEMGLLDIMEGEVLMVKTDMSGAVLWEQSHDKPGALEVVNRITAVPSDGGFLVATMLIDGYRPWFFKTDAEGNMLWESAAWSDLLGENTASQTLAYQLPTGDIACVVANDVFRQINIYTVDNSTGDLISTTTHTFEDIIGMSLFSASTSDIVNTADGGFLFASRFGVTDSFANMLIEIDETLALASTSNIGLATDNFFSAQIALRADGSLIITGAKNVGFFGDVFQASIAIFGTDYNFINYASPIGDLFNSTLGEIAQTPSGNYKLIRYNYDGVSFDPATGDYLEIVSMNAAFVETDSAIINYAPYNLLTFITAVSDEQYITGGMAWVIGEPNYYLVIASGAGGALPACIFNCVWPGDADNSGVADMDDILAIGLGYGNTGDVRDDMSIDWYAHFTNEWATALPSGVNNKYTDCNGDGIINEADTTAVSNNFSLEHAVYSLKTAAGEVPLIFAPIAPLVIGENAVPILLGNETDFVDALYGLRFTAFAEGESIDATTVKVKFNDSFIGDALDLLSLSKTINDIPAAAGAVAKTDHVNATGYGEIGTLNFVVIDNIAGKVEGSPVSLRFENIRAIDVNENEISIAPSDLSLESPTEIVNSNSTSIHLYPNPVTTNEIFIVSENAIESIELFNMYGESVYSRGNISTTKITLPDLANGQYMINVQTAIGSEAIMISVLGH